MKNAKHLLRLLGCILITAMMFSFGSGTLQAQSKYVKVTSVDELTENGTYLIVCETKSTAASLISGTNKYCSSASGLTFSNGEIELTAATGATGTEPHEFALKKSGTNWTIQDIAAQKYWKTTAAKAMAYDESPWNWTIEITSGNAIITSSTTAHGTIQYNAGSPRFLNYTSNQTAVQLYKKQDGPSCAQVSDVQAELSGCNTVKLSWTAPATAPANGYKVSINKKADNAEVVKDATVAAGITEYTYSELTENTEYTYSIVSVCGEGDESQAATGTFKTKAAICPQASNINAVTNAAFTLTWQDATANETDTEVALVPEKYHIKITTAVDAATAVKDEDINAGVQTYSYADPTAGTEYTYTFHSVCADSKTSSPKTDKFTPVAADAKTLNVSLSGSQENGKYTGTVTFTFATDNFTIGTDGKVKYSIIGNRQDIEETLTTENSVSHNLLSGDYIAEFELVDMDGKSLANKVSDDAYFTVDLPDVAAPEFSLAEQTAAFTEAQTLTLSCGTRGAKICYAIGETGFTEYTEAINLDKNGTFTVKAFAVKEKMDTSATVSKTYTLKLPLHVPGIVVYSIDFNTSQTGWTKQGFTQKEGDGFRFGSGAAGGSLELAQPLNLMEEFIVYFQAKVYNQNTNENKCKVSATVDGETQTKEITNLIPNEYKEYALPFSFTATNPEKSVSATIKVETYENSGNNRFIAKELKVYQADSTPKPQPVCSAVSNVRSKAGYDNVVFSWDQPTPEPALGFAVEIFTADTLTSVKRDTTQAYTLLVDGLNEGEKYVYSITSLCAAGLSSETVMGTVNTLKKGVPHIAIDDPGEGREYVTGTVTFNYHVEEFTLGTSETDSGFVKYTITGERLAEPISDTCTQLSFTQEFEFSGNYTVELSLVDKKMNTVEAAHNVSRNFSVNLPDVEKPVFAPEATSLEAVTDVMLSCSTNGATIYHSINDADFTEYTGAIKLDSNGTYAFRAYAAKKGMDNSPVVSKTYTLMLPVEIEGEIVFEEPFDKITVTSDGTANIAGELDNYTNMPGWSGENVYQGQDGCAKLGTSSKPGYLQTPAIDLSANEGKFILSFDAKAYNNASEKGSIKLIVNNKEQTVTGLPKDEMKNFVFAFTSGTESSTIRFTAVEASKNRFYLDNIRIYQVLPAIPTLTVPVKLALSTIQNENVAQNITVKGKLLEADVTVSCPEGNFSVSPVSLPKADVMSEGGAEITVSFNGRKEADSTVITLTSGTLVKEIKVKGAATPVLEADNIAALRAGTDGSLYKIKGEVILTAKDAYRNYKWIEDESGAILIDDATGLVTTSYEIGDGITGVYGKLGSFRGQLQLIMTGNLPEASSHGNAIQPEVLSINELTGNIDTYCSRLVRINGLTLVDPTGNWASNEDHFATDKDGNQINIRTFVRNGSFVDAAKPQGQFDLIALAGVYDGTVQVSPRTFQDIISDGENPQDVVATPVFTPASGATLKMGDVITINCTTSGATIYYTIDGSTPTVSSQRYTDGITMTSERLTVKAFAVKEGLQDSKVAEASYTTNVANEEKDILCVRIYPNPNDGLFFVEVAEAVRMEIFNLPGMNLRTANLAAGKTEIALTQPGIYFIRLSNAQSTVVKRVVVR